ncbi:Lrp/AsnC ligand binding domain-containing protein [Candidatus Bathyarchaeota archaeon]|nr:Lrp/AsnC ligand binding domain-containing protein [Candidatus Bathyarchaeota archaeon]
MEKAYVLLTIEMRSEKEVLNALNEIPDVKEVYQLHGVYDFVIQVEAETPQELKNLINRIRDIREIRSTLSLICIKKERPFL